MQRAPLLVEFHLCPDCHSEEIQGLDKFGSPRPCARCLVARLVKAFHADLEEQGITMAERSRQLV